jgi:hypothetical protein
MPFGKRGTSVLAFVSTALVLAVGASAALATATLKLCVPSRAGAALVTPKHGKCKHGYKLTALGETGPEGHEGPTGQNGSNGSSGTNGSTGHEGPAGKEGATGKEGPPSLTAEEAAELKSLLPYMHLVASGVGGKPTIQFVGANVQIINGEGKTDTTNGAGNLIIGYDEDPGTFRAGMFGPPEPGVQTGSHDLVIGTEQEFTSYGGVVLGLANSITGPWASVFDGELNTASGELAAIAGGQENHATGSSASVAGGARNHAEGESASVGGGEQNVASGGHAAVSGGALNTASSFSSSVTGGIKNTASTEELDSVSGGFKNTATGRFASILGGKELTATEMFETVP